MQSEYIELTYVEIGLASVLILINGAVSLLLKLRLERSLLLAAVRTVIQLVLIGLVLDWVFDLNRWYAVLLLVFGMTVVAGGAAVQRTERRYPGIYFDAILSVWISSWLMAAFALLVLLRQVDPWYHPQYSIPLVGMILGNTLTGVSLGLNRLGEELSTHRDQVELMLTLGATRWEAARRAVQQSVRTGMIPIINSMMIVGIVSLPGMMTGQLLAGVEPTQAVMYQIVIMFLIASGIALGTLGAVLLSYRRLFNDRHQFCHGKLDSV